MKIRTMSTFLGVLLLATCSTVSAKPKKKSYVDRIIAEFNKPNSNQVLVVAHRGDWRNHPENSIECVKSCIEMGIDIVELDVRKTKDGVFVLMHDYTVDRTTNGTGKINNMTLEEVKKLRLKFKGKVTNQQVPTFEEVLRVAKGRIMVNVDKAGISKELLEVIKKTGTLKQILFKSGKSVAKINADIAKCKGGDGVHFMPILKAGALKDIEKYFAMSIKPKAVELCFNKADSSFNTQKLLKACRAKGLRPWVNTMWGHLCAGHHDSNAVKDPEKFWGTLIEKGYNMIQTDNPKELLQYLRSKGLHKFDDRKNASEKEAA